MTWVRLLRWAPHALAVLLAVAILSMAVRYGRMAEAARLEPKIADAVATSRMWQRRYADEIVARNRAENALRTYYAELEVLRNRPRPAGPVRLCRNPAPRVPGPAGGADGAPAGPRSDADGAGGDSAEGAGPDIGPDLYALAASCDAVNARLRALQEWVKR